MRHLPISAIVIFGLLLAGAPAGAGEPADAREPHAHAGVHAGVSLPQLGSELGTTLGLRLEGGLQVWKQLAAVVAVGYSQPPVDTGDADPRLTAGTYTASTTQRELTVTAGALWRLRPEGAALNAFGGLGVRLYLLETVTNGVAGGEPFLENRETSARAGGVGMVGGELRLGPGAATLTVEVGGSDLPHVVTGDVMTTALGAEVGYRVFF